MSYKSSRINWFCGLTVTIDSFFFLTERPLQAGARTRKASKTVNLKKLCMRLTLALCISEMLNRWNVETKSVSVLVITYWTPNGGHICIINRDFVWLHFWLISPLQWIKRPKNLLMNLSLSRLVILKISSATPFAQSMLIHCQQFDGY